MENRNAHLFRINCMPNLLVLLLSPAIVASLSTKDSVIDVMKKDTNLCNNINVLYESEYIKSCSTVEYPTQAWNTKEDNLDQYLCLGVYDTAYKICHYSDRISFNNVEVFNLNKEIEKFIPTGTEENKEEKYCKKNLQEFTMLYSKLESNWGPLVEWIRKSRTCQKICFEFNVSSTFRPLCAVLAWIKDIEDKIKKSNAPGTNHNPVAPKPLVVHQTEDKKLEAEVKGTEQKEKKTEAEEPKEQLNDKMKNTSSNIPNEHTQPNTEKADSDLEKSSKQPQKTLNSTAPKTQDHNPSDKGKEDAGNIKVETNAEAPKAPDNVPSKGNVSMKEVAKGENAEEPDKKKTEEFEETKTSTISENTQDQYGAGNSDDLQDTVEGISNENINTYKCAFV